MVWTQLRGRLKIHPRSSSCVAEHAVVAGRSKGRCRASPMYKRPARSALLALGLWLLRVGPLPTRAGSPQPC
jgi:hypothetical protein